MQRLRVASALGILAIASTGGSLHAQMRSGTAPARPTSLQITGAMTVPAFGYADYTSDIGWNATGALIVRRGAFNSIRLEGEFNSVGIENAGGSSEVYGGGIGGGRVVIRGNVQQEGYLVAGLYNSDVSVCTSGGSCVAGSELQFGTKFGTNLILGRGKARFVLDFHWLGTWSQPYVNMFVVGGGLRF